MFKSERLNEALAGTQRQRLQHLGGGLPPFLLEEESGSRRPLRVGIAVAVVFHLLLFAVVFPQSEPEPQRAGSQRVHYIVKQTRFEPPTPRPQIEQPKPRTARKKIPVPDPTPDDPEPIVVAEIDAPLTDDLLEIDGIVGIPDGPPDDGRAGALPLSGDIDPPVKLYAPQPLYTEEARRAGIQGVVILEAVVDAEGNVQNVKVLKGLPMGLDKSAVDAVMSWRYDPARQNGRPVPVYFTFTISFSLT